MLVPKRDRHTDIHTLGFLLLDPPPLLADLQALHWHHLEPVHRFELITLLESRPTGASQ